MLYRYREAKWLCAILAEEDAAPLVLTRQVSHRERVANVGVQRIEVDASLWGGGAILVEDNCTTAWMAVKWDRSELFEGHSVGQETTGDQCFWEFLMSLPWWHDPRIRSIDRPITHPRSPTLLGSEIISVLLGTV